MQRIRLIHWNATEAEKLVGSITASGYLAEYDTFNVITLGQIRENPPDAFIIDLNRLPSQGRDLAINFRKHKATRNVPIIFVGGRSGKVTRIKQLLPDAAITTWPEILEVLADTLAHPPKKPFVPDSVFAGYAGKPLPQKLGIKDKITLALVNAPNGFIKTLGLFPPEVLVQEGIQDHPDMTLWFVHSLADLESSIKLMVPYANNGGLWIIWPKKSSGVASDLSQKLVRKTGLGMGLVDFKICSIDETWSGLRFTLRK